VVQPQSQQSQQSPPSTKATPNGRLVQTSSLPVYESIWPAGLFKNCHAPTVYRHGNGDVYAATFAGTSEKNPDVRIIVAKRSGGRWGTSLMHTFKVNGEAHWNPVLFAGTGNKADTLWIHFKVGIDTRIWVTYVSSLSLTSPAAQWSTPVRLPNDPGQRPRGCVKNKPGVDPRSGVIVAGSSVETDSSWTSFTDTSRDGGATWTRGKDVPMNGGVTMIQPTLWFDVSGAVNMMTRTKNGKIYRSTSTDQGGTWSKALPTAMPNNNSGVDVAALPDGRLLLAYNNNGQRARYPLRVGVSYDNGASFPHWMDIEPQAGEYSYPAIVAWGTGDEAAFGLVYTWRRTTTKYVEMKMSKFYELIGAAPPGGSPLLPNRT
jgi:predicted neuraminidase